MLCAFYHFMFPIISFFGVLSLLMQFYVDKFLLLRVYKPPSFPLEQSLVMSQLYLVLLFGLLVLAGEYMEFRYIHSIWLPEEFEPRMSPKAFYNTRVDIVDSLRLFMILIGLTFFGLMLWRRHRKTY